MKGVAELPENLQAGLRTLIYVPELSVGGDWTFEGGMWTVPCELRSTFTSQYVPAISHWYLRVAGQYPHGTLKFKPAREGGIQVTFPHQRLNVPVKGERYLAGDPCLTDPASTLGRGGDDPEPRDAYGRLAWHARRLVEWIEDAARDQLLRPGDPFEHPAMEFSEQGSVAFYEEASSYAKWQGQGFIAGDVTLGSPGNQPNVWYALEFRSEGRVIHTPPWGTNISETTQKQEGLWLLVPELPTISPWSYPRTWGELRQTLTSQGVDLDAILRSQVEGWRDGKPRTLLLGYPVSKTVGQPNDQAHWQACMVPAVSRQGQHAKGFRSNKQGRWIRDRCKIFGNPCPIHWLRSSNQQPEELGSRGYMKKGLRELKYVLIGAGALGSAIAEHLVRTGVTNLVVLDEDLLAGGNLTRHTLTMPYVGRFKAPALTSHLNDISPLARVVGCVDVFPPQDSLAVTSVNEADVLIDTTGNDDVIDALAQQSWSEPKVIVSLSLGWRAQSLYAYAERTQRFNAEAFRTDVGPHVANNLQATETETAPWEGIGCWAPVFPALHTDIQLLAVTGVTFLKEFTAGDTVKESRIYEQVHGDNGFEGLRRRPLC